MDRYECVGEAVFFLLPSSGRADGATFAECFPVAAAAPALPRGRRGNIFKMFPRRYGENVRLRRRDGETYGKTVLEKCWPVAAEAAT